MSVFYKGDAEEMIKRHIPSKSVNLIYINPPFEAATRNYWDKPLDWKALFAEFFRVLKDDGMLVIHCAVPFNYHLIRIAPREPNYSWYWKKESPTCPLIANVQPLRIVEEVLVWRNKKNTYYRKNIGTEERNSTYMGKTGYYGATTKKGITKMIGKTRTHFLEMPRRFDDFSTRPLEMMRMFYELYSKPGDCVLDAFCYEGVSSTQAPGRHWIGIDKFHFPKYLLGAKKAPLSVVDGETPANRVP
jgi:DNA modification methylase